MSATAGPLPAALVAALADRYRIERELGRGGMATVYLARDLKHDRDVAIKVLHEDLGATLGPERFLAEIKTTAKLQHPHILPLLDSGAGAGLLYYVMPYVAGETLRDRLTRDTQLPIEDAVRIAREVADALAHAHAAGIVHRDIKPENILLQGGHAVVADFGIALAVQHAGGARLTQTGLSLGTPQYMAPEQAMGEKTVGPSADIYALGAVTYEMLTGEPPFTGATVQAIVARVLNERPTSITTLRDTVPEFVNAAVMKALAKLPADRWNSAAELAAEIAGRGIDAMPRDVRRHPRRSAVVAIAAAATLAAFMLGWVVRASRSGTIPAPPNRFSIVLPDWAPLGTSVIGGIGWPITSLALTPDGRKLLYVGGTGGVSRLYVRPLDRDSVMALPATEGALGPFTSPDGEWVGFFVGNSLRKVRLAGGDPITLAEVNTPSGATWLADGRIVVAEVESYLFTTIPGAGGRKDTLHTFQLGSGLSASLPGDDWLLAGRRLVSMRGKPSKSLIGTSIVDDSMAWLSGATPYVGGMRFVAPGFLVWVESGRLAGAPFDLRRMQLRGQPILSSDRVNEPFPSVVDLAVSSAGLAVFAAAPPLQRIPLVRAEFGGRLDTLALPSGSYAQVAWAPDGRKIAVNVLTFPGTELRLVDVVTRQSVLLAKSASYLGAPHFRAGGRSIVYSEKPWTPVAVTYEVDATGGEPRRIAGQPGGTLIGAARHGDDLAFQPVDAGRGIELWRPGGATRRLTTQPHSAFVDYSPDDRWIAWASNVSGRWEVYAARADSAAAPRRVTDFGCNTPRWTSLGRALLCRGHADSLMRIPIATHGVEIQVGIPRSVGRFSMRDEGDFSFDVSPDGRRIVFAPAPTARAIRVLNVITNVAEELRRQGSLGRSP